MNPLFSGEYTARTALPPPLPPPPPLDIDFNTNNHLEISNEDDFDQHDDNDSHDEEDKKTFSSALASESATSEKGIKQTDTSQARPAGSGKICAWQCDLCKKGAPNSVKNHTPPTWVMVCRTALALLTNSEVARKENRKFFHFKKELCKFIDEHADSLCLRERSTTWQNTVNMTLSHPSYKDIFVSGQSEILMPGYYGLKDSYDPYSDVADQWAQSQLLRKQRAPGGSKRKASASELGSPPQDNVKQEVSPTNSSNSVTTTPAKKILKAMPPSMQFHMQVPLSSPGQNSPPTTANPTYPSFPNQVQSSGSSQNFSYEDDSEENDLANTSTKSDDPNSPASQSSKGEKKQHRLTTNLEKQLLEDFYVTQVKARHNKLRSDSEPFLQLVARLGWDPRRVRTWVENRKIKDKRKKDKNSTPDFKMDFENDDESFADQPIDLTSQQATSQKNNNNTHPNKKPRLDESMSSDSDDELDLTSKQRAANNTATVHQAKSTAPTGSTEVQFSQESLMYERQLNERTKKQLNIAEDMISELQALNSLLRERNSKLEEKLAESIAGNKKLLKQVEALEKMATEDANNRLPEPNYEKYNSLVQQFKEQKGEEILPQPQAIRNAISRVPSTNSLPPASPVNVPPPVQTPQPSAPSPTPQLMAPQPQTVVHRASPVPQVVHLASLTPQQAQQYRISNLMNQAPVHHTYPGLPMGVAPPFPLGMPMHPLHQLTPPQSHQGAVREE
mmetsp:Transcript_25993/g.36565  ORF Transcript_25993/g.36565 Transcript_25993/m.36565 type:complete len:731 (-) Transcript_25993:134-2326(-)